MDLLDRVEREIVTERLFEKGDRIVVAVSGGPDSTALLHILFALSERWSWTLVVAHLDHRFRGEESAEEARFVAELAAGMGLPGEIAHEDVPKYIRETGQNPQAAARELRYRFLRRTADKHGANRIALAHHADDQAETLLMRFLRGTGPAGLSGIPKRRVEKSVELVRPLLRIYKLEILEYCKTHNINYSVDSSNLKRNYLRNQIRLELLPQLQRDYNEQLPQALNRLSEMMSAENSFLEAQSEALFEQFVDKESGGVKWSRKWFRCVHVALQRRLIKLILNYLAFEADFIDFLKLEQMRDAILKDEPSNLSLDIGRNVRLTREYDRISLHIYVVPSIPFDYALPFRQGALHIPETGASLECLWLDSSSPETAAFLSMPGPNVAWFDAERLEFPLQVRSRTDGDRMSLYGLNGSKKVKDIFIDAKIPPSERCRVPVVTDKVGRIVWLSGVRRSSLAPVGVDTRLVLYMKFHTPEDINPAFKDDKNC